MSKPLLVTIPHRLGKAEAKRRIKDGLGQIRGQIGAFASSLEEGWEGDRLNFRFAAVGQMVTGGIEVLEEEARVEILLPGMLGFLGRMLKSRIQDQGKLLLTKR